MREHRVHDDRIDGIILQQKRVTVGNLESQVRILFGPHVGFRDKSLRRFETYDLRRVAVCCDATCDGACTGANFDNRRCIRDVQMTQIRCHDPLHRRVRLPLVHRIRKQLDEFRPCGIDVLKGVGH
nr:hypothetical protein [Ruegeria marisrubri]